MPRTNDPETPKPEPDPFAPRRPAPPRLPRALAHVDPPDAATLPDTTWRGIRAEGWSVPGTAVSTLEFDSCALDGLDLSRVECARLLFADCEIRASSLANLAVRDPSLVRVAIRGSRLTGLSWGGGILTDVLFEGCRLDLSSFRFARLQRVTFRRCLLADADFEGVEGSSVAFEECDLRRATFSQARFARSVIRHCELEGLGGVAGLSGLGLLPEDILALAGPMATALGIRTLER